MISVVFVTDDKYELCCCQSWPCCRWKMKLSKIDDSMGKYSKKDNSTELNVTPAHRWGLVLSALLGQDAACHSIVHLSKGDHKRLIRRLMCNVES